MCLSNLDSVCLCTVTGAGQSGPSCLPT
uniref:Uncharacterized protein n=1 Tax=Anguilla anguilla TaxID=7936 RepID=A0A0E9V5V7_ANGAN